MTIDNLRQPIAEPHGTPAVYCGPPDPASHLEPRPAPKPTCPDCGRPMGKCDRCVCAEAGIPPRTDCPCGEEPGTHYLRGKWYGPLCFARMANDRAWHDFFTRGPE